MSIHFNGEFMERSELGNKGANLVAMTRLDLPVPPGFIVAIQAYKNWRQTGNFPGNGYRRSSKAIGDPDRQKIRTRSGGFGSLFSAGFYAGNDGYYPQYWRYHGDEESHQKNFRILG